MAKANSTRRTAGSSLSPPGNPRAKKRTAAAAPSAEPAIRPLKDIQAAIDGVHAEMDRLRTPFLDASQRFHALEEERAAHPETIETALTQLRLGADGPTGIHGTEEPELGAMLEDIASELDDVEACIHVVYYALDAPGSDINTISNALRAGAVNNITEQIDRLRAAIKGARLKGSRMVVVKASEDEEAGS
jgi:hypothetical protein